MSVQKVSTNILLIESLYSDDNRYDETFLSNYAIINLQNPHGPSARGGAGAGAWAPGRTACGSGSIR